MQEMSIQDYKLQCERIFADGNTEDDGCDILEAVDPLLALIALTSDIKDACVVRSVTEKKRKL